MYKDKKPITGYKVFRNPETGQEIRVPIRDDEFVDPDDLVEALAQLPMTKH